MDPPGGLGSGSCDYGLGEYPKYKYVGPVQTLLGGSWDLVSKVISTLIGVISIVTLVITLVNKSHDPLSTSTPQVAFHRGLLVRNSGYLPRPPGGSKK